MGFLDLLQLNKTHHDYLFNLGIIDIFHCALISDREGFSWDIAIPWESSKHGKISMSSLYIKYNSNISLKNVHHLNKLKGGGYNQRWGLFETGFQSIIGQESIFLSRR